VQLIFAIAFLLGGLAGLIWCFILIWRSIDSEDWEQVDCLILLSRVENRSADSSSYVVVVEYKYSVGGVTYVGNRVRWLRFFISKRAAHDVCRKYSMGTNAKVSIDPNDPSRSVLIPDIPPAVYFFLLAFGSLVALSLGTILSKYVGF